MAEQTGSTKPFASEAHYRLLALLEKEPHLSQRELAQHLGVSLGKVNYCLRALVEKGWLKVGNFRRSSNKRAYLYQLTPRGIQEKTALALRFLRRKEAEHDALVREIACLREEIRRSVDS